MVKYSDLNTPSSISSIIYPDSEKFHSFVELGQLKEQALKELEQEKQRVKALEALLREKGIDYD